MQHILNEPFRPQDLQPCAGNPVKYRLSVEARRSTSFTLLTFHFSLLVSEDFWLFLDVLSHQHFFSRGYKTLRSLEKKD